MRRVARDFRFIARQALRGRWGVAIGVTIVASLLGAAGNSFLSIPTNFSGNSSSFSYDSYSYSYDWPFSQMTAFMEVMIAIALIFSLVSFIVGGAATLGLCLFNIRLVRGEPVTFKMLFERFTFFGKAFGLRFMMGLFIFLWSLLFIIPGIVAAYRYAMAPYLLAENPEMGIMEAIDRSKQMMHGNKGRLFCLHLSFIGWHLLATLTLGILELWISPYMCAAEAAFYLDLCQLQQNMPQGGYQYPPQGPGNYQYPPQAQGGYPYPPQGPGNYQYPPQAQGGYPYPPQGPGNYQYPPQAQGGYQYPPQGGQYPPPAQPQNPYAPPVVHYPAPDGTQGETTPPQDQ